MAYKLSWKQFGDERETFRYSIFGIAFALRKIFKTGVNFVFDVKLTKLL